MKINILTAWIVLSVVLVLGGCSDTSYLDSAESGDVPEEDTNDSIEDQPVEAGSSLYVQVAGAVIHPGVYELDEGSRVFQAIEAAGGLSDDADDRTLNQASAVSDGDKIYVQTYDEAVVSNNEAASAVSGDEDLVNINTAGTDELKTLSGIGESKAASIISYRDSHSGFKSVDELTQVDGIGDATLNKIRDMITI